MITCQVGKKKIDTFSYEPKQLREWSNKGLLKCPVCGSKMIYNHGEFKIPHFKHEKNCDCPDIYSEGVTEEHIKGIELLHNWLQKQEGITNIELEKWIPETKQRPDIYFEYENKPYVIEFQCSPISTKFLERRELYRLNEINDIWILGCDKYDINNVNILNKFQVSDINLNKIKHKKIEQEIYAREKYILYIRNNDLIKITRAIQYLGYKTLLHLNLDSKELDKCLINDILSSDDLYKENEMSSLDIFKKDIEDDIKSYNEEFKNIYNFLQIRNRFYWNENNLWLNIQCTGEITKESRSFYVEEYDKNKLYDFYSYLDSEYKNRIKDCIKFQTKCDIFNNQYKVVNKNCNFELVRNFNNKNYLYYIKFDCDTFEREFFIKDKQVDYVKWVYKPRPTINRRGGTVWRRIECRENIETYILEHFNIDEIFNFITTKISNKLRSDKYGYI